jgi:hypothetical protein
LFGVVAYQISDTYTQHVYKYPLFIKLHNSSPLLSGELSPPIGVNS